MKKVCHLTSVHSIDDVRIFVKECSSLAANGFDVTLIACGDTTFEEEKNGVKRISLHIPVKNKLQRMIRRPKAVYKKALEIDANIYHFHDPELIPIGLKLKRKGKKVVYDSHEDTPVLLKSANWIPVFFRDIVSLVYSIYEKRNVREFDAIISVTPFIVKKFKRINKNTHQITNYPKISSDTDKLILDLNRENIAFAGAISHAYLLDNTLKALDKTRGTKLILAGSTVSNQYLNYLKSLKGWSKVNYIGKISHIEVENIYKKSLIGIACLDYTPNVGYKEGSLGVIKFFEYMAAGMAIICTDFKLWQEIIDKYKCGICVNPHDINEIGRAIQYLVDNPSIALEMGQNGQKAIDYEYNWKTQEAVLLKLYSDLL